MDIFQSAYELATRTPTSNVAVLSGAALENYVRDKLLKTAVASANCQAPVVGRHCSLTPHISRKVPFLISLRRIGVSIAAI